VRAEYRPGRQRRSGAPKVSRRRRPSPAVTPRPRSPERPRTGRSAADAGTATGTSPLDRDTLDATRQELEVNYLGLLSVSRAFAPALARNGGGALVNILSVLSWVSFPQIGNYAASKAAAGSATNALRTLLAPDGLLVLGVHFGYVDTDMTARVDAPKLDPVNVAAAIVAAIGNDDEELIVDPFSQGIKAALSDDQNLIYPRIHAQYDATLTAAAR
jgi:NAD(P)-dependent dehydrogenase (short-subunit alcohol dehydrogenase family)